jgi:hypothetical protein
LEHEAIVIAYRLEASATQLRRLGIRRRAGLRQM